jgi:hypothetical protein
MKVSHRRSEALADHGHVQAHMRLGWRSPLMFVLSGLYIDTRHDSILSQVMVMRTMQFGFEIYFTAKSSMSWMLSLFPLVPTLRIKPVRIISKLVRYGLNLGDVPGRSTKEISLYSGPVISKQTMLEENERSAGALKSTLASKKVSAAKSGLRIANWARSTRSFTESLSVMSSPKGSLDVSDEFVPPEVEYRRKKTRHNHVSPRIKRHSIGHLRTGNQPMR